jgi:general secretion pathway protein A
MREEYLYEQYFGLTEAPFSIAPNPQYLYMSNRHREALAHLQYGIGNNGFILLTGEVGTGKTTVCRCLLDQLPGNVDTAFVVNPKLTANELLATICDDLGVSYPENATSKILIDRLNAHLVNTIGNDRRTLLIIDEAQNLSVEVLEQLRLLTNLETNQRKLLQIILLGQPELLDTLSKQSLRQLAQRITASFHLDALNKKEVAEYIAHRLSVAGARGNFFKRSAMDRIYSLSKGVPRVINLICDRSLLGAFAENKAIVSSRIVNKAAKEILLDHSTDWRGPISIAATIASIGILGWWLLQAPVTYESAVVPQSTPPAVMALTQPGKANLNFLPVSQTIGHSDRRQALDDLFALWGLYIEDESACNMVLTVGLSCLEEARGLHGIQKYNRPAIIHLHSTGQWITISNITEDSATLIAAEREYEVGLAELTAEFDGSYLMLWRMPPGYTKPLSLGDSGSAVDWLVYQLALLNKRSPSQTTGYTFDAAVLNQVRRFQTSVDVPANGIVDPQTWIYLNNIEGINIPLLRQDNHYLGGG